MLAIVVTASRMMGGTKFSLMSATRAETLAAV
jgi:hypothetical protein